MKSVIEEGSSISQAIQSGWTKAGKPKEFTVKIFQEPKKNFFGFTTIVAKIGIFFNEEYREKDKNTNTRPSNQYRHNNRPNPHHSKNINYQGQNQAGQRASETNTNRTDNQSQKQNGEQTNQRPYPPRNRHRPYNKFRKKTDNGTNSKPK